MNRFVCGKRLYFVMYILGFLLVLMKWCLITTTEIKVNINSMPTPRSNITTKENAVQNHRIHTMLKGMPSVTLSTEYCKEEASVIFDANRKLLYCQIAKVASTFWMRILNIIIKQKDISNPFDLPRFYVDRDILPKWEDNKMDTSDWLKFLFVRNPFDRLLATYIDKFVSPNLTFFKAGKYIISSKRENPNSTSIACGHDVTFSEFLEVVTSEKMSDIHWCPMYKMCKLNKIQYSFIGKMETFDTDAKLLFKRLTSESKTFQFSSRQDTVDDLISTNLKRVFEIKSHPNKGDCKIIDFKYALKRFWKVLKLKAIIDFNIQFPFENTEMDRIKPKLVVEYIKAAEKSSFEHYSQNEIRKHVLHLAYSSLPKHTYTKFIEHFRNDFVLFGYDMHLKKPSEKISWNPFI